MDAKAIGDRIHMLIKKNKITAKELSLNTGIKESALTSYKKGEYAPSAEALINISEYFNVTVDWLLKGENKNLQAMTGIEPIISKIEPLLSIDEERLIDDYRDMTTDGKRRAQIEIKNLRDEYKKPKGTLSNSNRETENENYSHKNSSVG